MVTKYKIHVISGTHWDREWRYTADQSLLRLTELVDELLEILETKADYKCFLLDGGTVVIEDYLTVRPEKAERLRKLMKAGRIQTVMWYTLPEMSSVYGESLIRNLLIGKQYTDSFGGTIKTGYTATSYGQISQLPQIYAGFEMHTAMTYRGTNKHQVPPVCLWESPDGTKIYHIRCFDEVTRTNWFFFPHYRLILGKNPRDLSTKWTPNQWPVHMADEMLYKTAFQLKNESMKFNTDKQEMVSAVQHLVAQAKPQAIGNHLLALDMEDNAVPYPELNKMIDALNTVQKDYYIQQSTLDEYVESCLENIENEKLHTHKGEMRYTLVEPGYNGLLGATHSSRTPLKLMNDQAQMELINIAEPLCSISSMFGNEYQSSLLKRAWLELLKNHAHDSICGAAIDSAHKDNPGRFRAAIAIAHECSRKACENIWLELNTISAFKEGDITLTFFNTLPINRKGVQSIIIDVPNISLGDVMIQPCTGAGPIIEGFNPDEMISYLYYDIIDEDGNKVPYELLEREDIEIEVERKLDSNAAACKVQRNRVLVDVNIPAFGYKTYALRPRKREFIYSPQPGPDRELIASSDGVLENRYIKITINPNGTFNITDKETGKDIKNMHYFCDNGSTGVAHINKTPLRDYTVTSLGSSAAITLLENNSLRGIWRIEMQLMIPAAVDLDSRNRSEKMVPLPITTFLTLRKGSRYVEIKTKVTNAARDHRLRVMLPTDVKTDYTYADGPFDILKRQIQWHQTGENMEPHHPFKPMLNFVSATDDDAGMTFLSKGLNEYEVVDDARRTLAVTLLRTTRHYMAANRGLFTPEEYQNHSGQHCLGVIEFEYAVYIHGDNPGKANLFNVSQDYKVQQRILQGVPKVGQMPPSRSFIDIGPSEHVHISALYKDQNNNRYILRIWNSSKVPVNAWISSVIKFSSLKKISMDQKRLLEEVGCNQDKWSFSLRQMEIATFAIEVD